MIDVWSYISLFINNDKDKCNLLMTSQELSHCKIFFHEMININSISESRWFHQFTNILTSSLATLPKNIKILNFADKFNKPINNYISYGVVHLSFGYMFNQSLYECIPSSVTHLEFRNKKISFSIYHSHFTHTLNDSISSSIKYLIIESNMINCDDIDKLSAITHMTINHYHLCNDRKIVPSSVLYLTIGACYQLSENLIPPSVIYLTFNKYIGFSLRQFIPTSVKKIYFHNIIKNITKKFIHNELKDLNVEIIFCDD